MSKSTFKVGTIVKAVTQRGTAVKGKLIEIKKSAVNGSTFFKIATDDGRHVHVRPSTAARA